MVKPNSEPFITPINAAELAAVAAPMSIKQELATATGYAVGQKIVISTLAEDYAEAQLGKETYEREAGEAEQRARTDELTGLPNRRGLVLKIEELIATRPGGFGVLFADIDGLKEMNDRLGHKAGDQLIRRGAEALANGLGTHHTRGHMASRQSGDELVGIVEDVADEDELEQIGAGVRHSFDEAQISISLGVALHQAGETATDVIAKADKAMYEIKEVRKDLRAEAEADAEFASLPPELQDHYERVADLLFDSPGSDIEQFIRIVRPALRARGR